MNILVAGGMAAALTAYHATTTILIAFVGATVGFGFAAAANSYMRPSLKLASQYSVDIKTGRVSLGLTIGMHPIVK